MLKNLPQEKKGKILVANGKERKRKEKSNSPKS
jgi:hypothetical protein